MTEPVNPAMVRDHACGHASDHRLNALLFASGAGRRPAAEATSTAASDGLRHPVRRRTLLVAEDDEVLLDCIAETLGSAGYQVLSASSVPEAAQLFASDEGIELVVADVVMPIGNEPPLRERLRAIRPEIPVLFISGYQEQELTRHGLLHAGDFFIQKPFTSEEIVARVDELLEGRTPRSES
jgi:CheY-like chemotaxis protein